MAFQLTSQAQQALIRAAILDMLCVGGGVGLFLLTGQWVWLVAGILLGVGFIVPAVIEIMKSRG